MPKSITPEDVRKAMEVTGNKLVHGMWFSSDNCACPEGMLWLAADPSHENDQSDPALETRTYNWINDVYGKWYAMGVRSAWDYAPCHVKDYAPKENVEEYERGWADGLALREAFPEEDIWALAHAALDRG